MTLNLPPCPTQLDWKAWKWPGERMFAVPKTKYIYEKLCYTEDWVVHLNRVWCKQWPLHKWTQVVGNIWRSKCDERDKVFLWRILFGLLPTGEKAKARGLGDGRCIRCNHQNETLLHLVWGCPEIKVFIGKICKWVHKSLDIPFFRRDLAMGSRRVKNEELSNDICTVRATVLMVIWQSRNELLFQSKTEPFHADQVMENCWWQITCRRIQLRKQGIKE